MEQYAYKFKGKVMKKLTYTKLEGLTQKYKGYIRTDELLKEGLTNRQIANFVNEGMLEKICHGHYWLRCADYNKPDNYKVIEVCISNSHAVICADSACFYQGLIDVEPPIVSIATRRSDRSKINMNFPTKRHYFLDNIFEESYTTVITDFGEYNIYDKDKSVCDCIRFKEDIDTYIFELIIENYHKSEDKQKKRLLAYAQRLKIEKRVEKYL